MKTATKIKCKVSLKAINLISIYSNSHFDYCVNYSRAQAKKMQFLTMVKLMCNLNNRDCPKPEAIWLNSAPKINITWIFLNFCFVSMCVCVCFFKPIRVRHFHCSFEHMLNANCLLLATFPLSSGKQMCLALSFWIPLWEISTFRSIFNSLLMSNCVEAKKKKKNHLSLCFLFLVICTF